MFSIGQRKEGGTRKEVEREKKQCLSYKRVYAHEGEASSHGESLMTTQSNQGTQTPTRIIEFPPPDEMAININQRRNSPGQSSRRGYRRCRKGL